MYKKILLENIQNFERTYVSKLVCNSESRKVLKYLLSELREVVSEEKIFLSVRRNKSPRLIFELNFDLHGIYIATCYKSGAMHIKYIKCNLSEYGTIVEAVQQFCQAFKWYYNVENERKLVRRMEISYKIPEEAPK